MTRTEMVTRIKKEDAADKSDDDDEDNKEVVGGDDSGRHDRKVCTSFDPVR